MPTAKRTNGAASPDTAAPRSRQPWAEVDGDSADEARWRAQVEVRLDGLHDKLDDVISAVSKGGPVSRIVLAVATHPNGKWYAGAALGLVAIVYGASVGFGADGFTIGGGMTSSPSHAAGPAPQPAPPQE